MTLYQIFKRVMPYYKPYWLFAIAALGAIIVAVGMPFRCIPQATLYISYNDVDNEEIKNDMELHLPVLAGITVTVVIAQFVNRYIIYMKSSEMINDVRVNMFSAIMHQPLSYFSAKEHSAGELTAILSEDMRMLNVSSVDTYIILLQGVAGMIAGGLI
jgi:ABC-type multidrug transport system fused ATPase/permease subunit